jgi:hypothetical protein
MSGRAGLVVGGFFCGLFSIGVIVHHVAPGRIALGAKRLICTVEPTASEPGDRTEGQRSPGKNDS